MASMRDIKRRRSSIQGTQQITKAMKLVSTAKLQRAKAQSEKSKTYFDSVYRTVNSILAKCGNIDHPYLTQNSSPKKAVIVITSNKGLAGGYNSNVVKLVTRNEEWENKEDIICFTVGSKGREALKRAGIEVREYADEIIDSPDYPSAKHIADEILELYKSEEIGEIYLAYTVFKNTVTQIPTLKKLLPVDTSTEELANAETGALMNFEPADSEALSMIIPKYVASLVFGGLIEARASENGARMQAMDNATSNADEMIGKLTLQYNRARQSSITQELTEIIAGAEAIS